MTTPALLPLGDFVPSDISYYAIAPLLIVFGAAIIGVLCEAFVPSRLRHDVQLSVALIGLVGAMAALWFFTKDHLGSTLSGALVIDNVAVYLNTITLVIATGCVLLVAERFGGRTAESITDSGASVPGSSQELLAERIGTTTEMFPLMMFSIAGMMMFPAAGDLLTMFVALEALSLPLYVLTALARRRRLLSQEAALKYFLLGSFSSAFFLFGAALLFGHAGTLNLAEIAASVGKVSGMDGLLVPGMVMVLIGLLFKVGAAPFHMWTPDVYQGAPTPITGFMAACTKIAAFGAMLRVIYVGIAPGQWDWQPMMWWVAGLTMVVGSLLAISQSDIKRMLAYSSVAHAGFILVGLLAIDKSGVSSVLFYVLGYGLTTVAAFGLLTLVRSSGSEATHYRQWVGLGKKHPLIAAAATVVLLSLAGMPLTSGFTAKFVVFAAAVAHSGVAGAILATVGVLCSVVTAFVYFKLIVAMYFRDHEDSELVILTPSIGTITTLGVCLLLTLILGVFPAPVLDFAQHSALFMR